MKPLIIVTSFNRKHETEVMLQSLADTTDLDNVVVAIVDNGSTDGTADSIRRWCVRKPNVEFFPLGQNIGCPRALNLALQATRRPCQPVVKIDNDVKIVSPTWLDKIMTLLDNWPHPVAMVSADYDGVLDNRVLGSSAWKGTPLYHVSPIIGHCVWHTGVFMDAVGYFDVLDDGHLYGFEDLIMSHKATKLGWDMIVFAGWRIQNIQRHNSLGDQRDEHVNRMRPLYNQRVRALATAQTVATGSTGRALEY